MRSLQLAVVLAVSACLTALSAQPVWGGGPVVVESYAGARPADADRLLAPLLTQLRSLGYSAGPTELGALIDARVARSGHPLDAAAIAELKKQVEAGYAQWLAGDYARAITELARAVDAFHATPGSVADDQALRDSIYKALVGLAMAESRSGASDAATAHMAELVRSFPDRELNRALFGPDALAFYRRVKAELDAGGRGTLEVAVDDPDAMVFLNERFEIVGNAKRTDLYPGRYRVYVRKGTSVGRVREIDVAAGATAQLSVTWAFDGVLRTGPAFVGFEYRSQKDRESLEGSHATTVARAVDASGVVVVTIASYQGRRSMIASMLSLDTGRPTRTGVIALEPTEPGADQVRGLAKFLVVGEPVPGVISPDDEKPVIAPDPAIRDEAPRRPYRAWKWITLGAGLAAVATGVTLIVLDQPASESGPGERIEFYRESRTPGFIVTGVGAALLGTGVVLWILDGRSRPAARSTAVGVTPLGDGGAVFSISGAW